MELIYVSILCCAYCAIWEISRRRLKKRTGVDMFVYGESTSKLQAYFRASIHVLGVLFLVLIICHGAHIHSFSFFVRSALLQGAWYDASGFVLGIGGLSVCTAAHVALGDSWRMGLDERRETNLVVQGIYRYVRHPTYLGQYMLCAALWLIWPTWSVALFGIVFFVLLEAQVRCEEEHLEKVHGAAYQTYCLRTNRYLPLPKRVKKSSPVGAASGGGHDDIER